MIEKNESIEYSKHPYSGEIYKVVDGLDKIFNLILIVLNSIGFIVAIVAATGLSKWASNYSGDVVDVPVNFFGYIIELESDSFGGSPFIVFLHTIIILLLISLVIFCIKTIVHITLNAKAKALDSIYRSEKMTELILVNSCSSKAE